MNKKTMQFELDKKSLKMKDILDKEFVEIEVYAISDAYPNRNNSVFPLESMKAALPSFANKPILGAWDNQQDDFKSHNCDLKYDTELESMYYDYTSPGCETPLGMIRESDKVEIVFDEERKENWIVVHAVLWSRYAYNQIKKLVRKNGRSKISVEIEVEESHIDDNGYEILDRFNFTGLTILGSEHGKAVEEGIENAHLNILELMNNALFQQKQKALAFAYSALDKYNSQQNVETPDEAKAEKDSNIQFNKDEDTPNQNEEKPQVSMEQENVNQEEGGISTMQLTMQAKIDLLREALQRATDIGHEEEECCCPYVWVMDMDDQFVYYELGDDKFRCPYAIVENEEGHEVNVDLSAQERVVPSWALFSAEEKPEEDEEDNLETEACGEKQNEDCNKTQEESCGDAKFDHEEGEGHKCIECTIQDLMIDEHEAIESYHHAIAHFGEEFPAIVAVFQDIANEELEHLGELEKCLEMLNPEVAEELAEGHAEALETIIEAAEEEHAEEHPQEFAEEDKPEEGEAPAKEEEAKEPEEEEEPKKEEEAKEDVPEDTEEPEKEEEAKEKDMPEVEQPISDTPDTGATKDDKPNATPPTSDAVDTTVKEYDDDEDDKEDDDDDEDDKEDDEPEDKDEEPREPVEGDEEFSIRPSQEVILNGEPLPIDTKDESMPEIVAEAVASILAPGVQTEAANLGDATKEAQAVLNKNTVSEISGQPSEMPKAIEPELDPLKDKVEQPDDNQKALEFSVNPDMEALLQKYAELEAKFNELNNAKKNEEASKLAQFGIDFINNDDIVDENTKQQYIAQVDEKCKAFELNSEDEVIKFATSLIAMYYYEKQVANKKKTQSELNIFIDKPAYVGNNASNSLKDAINKLNYLNKEE